MSKPSSPSVSLDSRAVPLPSSYTPAAFPRRSVPFPWHNSCITSPASPADPLSLSVLESTWCYLKPIPGFFVVVFGRRFLLLSIELSWFPIPGWILLRLHFSLHLLGLHLHTSIRKALLALSVNCIHIPLATVWYYIYFIFDYQILAPLTCHVGFMTY